jgi:hypothetical protein
VTEQATFDGVELRAVSRIAIRSRLIQRGLAMAADRSNDWTDDYWSAQTVQGKRRTIRTNHYRDHDWHAAYQAIVTAELIQAVGRGRSIMEAGIPVVVVSPEELAVPGLSQIPVWDDDLVPIGERQLAALQALRQHWASKLTQPLSKGLSDVEVEGLLTQPFSKGFARLLTQPIPNIYIGGGCVSTSQLASSLTITPQAVRKLLRQLVVSGWSRKVGERGGWLPGSGPLLQIALAARPRPPVAGMQSPSADEVSP